jgi:hypothetical protein
MKQVLVVALLLSSGVVFAQAKKEGKKGAASAGGAPPMPMMPKPGPETLALKPLIGALVTSGEVKAGAMGPSSPAMPAKGTHTCKWILDNLWVLCEIEDTAGAPPKAMTWKGQLIAGWDFEAKAYRGAIADNMGTINMMSGKLEGQKLVWDSSGTMMGKPVKYRITLDFTDAKAIKFTDERQYGGSGPFVLAEEGVMKPAGGK